MTFTAQVGSDPAIEVYGGTVACDAYVNAMIGSSASAYRALPSGGDDRKRLLIAATRYIDSWTWRGVADGLGGTTLQFPRSGIFNNDGTTVTDTTQLTAVVKAVFELVAILASDPDVITTPDQGSNVQLMGAGTGRMQFFRPTSALDGNASILPTVVDRLIGQWMASADPSMASVASGFSSGVNATSDFEEDDDDDDTRLDVNWPI